MPNNELMHIANGTQPNKGRVSREVVRQAKHITEEVKLAGLQVDASVALAAHVMQAVTQLDEHRKALAGEDVTLNLALSEVMMTSLRQVQALQQGNNGRTNCFGL